MVKIRYLIFVFLLKFSFFLPHSSSFQINSGMVTKLYFYILHFVCYLIIKIINKHLLVNIHDITKILNHETV